MNILVLLCMLLFFFFKQKTAYEMRISDWSSECALPIFQCERSGENAFRGACGKVTARAGRPRLKNDGMTLRRPSDIERATHIVIRAMMVQEVQGLRIEEGAVLTNGNEGVIVPAVPSPLDRKSTRRNYRH